jgi:hypothetical protein
MPERSPRKYHGDIDRQTNLDRSSQEPITFCIDIIQPKLST